VRVLGLLDVAIVSGESNVDGFGSKFCGNAPWWCLRRLPKIQMKQKYKDFLAKMQKRFARVRRAQNIESVLDEPDGMYRPVKTGEKCSSDSEILLEAVRD